MQIILSRALATLIIASSSVTFASADTNACRDIFATKPGAEKTVAHLHTDLDKYIAGMEKSSLQKAAYAALARPGHIIDLGAGSGIAARDLAMLFPNSQVTGVDLDPGMVRYAQEHYAQANLRYRTGNAETKNFPNNSLDTIFMSSTAHHLTSYGSGSFDVQHVRNAIAAAHAQLKPGGLYILRDFLAPTGPQDVWLELPTADGAVAGNAPELSTSALFEKFARDFRSSRYPNGRVPYQVVAGAGSGWKRYRLSFRDATEFLLRKDYRDNYDAEIKEEYTFMNQDQYETAFRAAGFRILHSAPIYNPWIIKNRYEGHARLFDTSGSPLPFPATNYVIAGEKITREQAMTLEPESTRTITAPRYLKIKAMRERISGKTYDVVSRNEETTDVLPYYKSDGRIYVLSKQGFPRPVLTTLRKSAHLNGVHSDGYVIEPISFLGLVPDVRDFATELRRRAGINPAALQSTDTANALKFYTSPGMSSERVTSVAIAIDATHGAAEYPDENYSGFSTSGTIRSIEASQVLRSAQAGSVLDSRLELGVYQLLLSQGASLGTWIGEDIHLSNQSYSTKAVQSAREILRIDRSKSRTFEETDVAQFGQYLRVREGVFVERNSQNEVIARAAREYVEPRHKSSSVMSAMLVAQIDGRVYVGLERRQLPSVQLIEGSSDIVTNPAWRMNESVKTFDAAKRAVAAYLFQDFNLRAKRIFTLGGAYHSSPGMMAETVYPVAIEVSSRTMATSNLEWVALDDLVAQRKQIRDGHLMIAALRLSHALGQNGNARPNSLK